jgi:phytoene dehydrogenase-like protein
MSIQIPTVKEPSLAPPGKHILSIWSQYAPVHLENNESWGSAREREGKFLIDTMSEYAPNFGKAIIDWSLFTPKDIEERVYMTDGNIRHVDMIPTQSFSSRPLAGWSRYETPITDLFLCGAGTHPGGEVTGAPGHNAAQAILRKIRAE